VLEMADKSIAQKLQIKAGQRMLILQPPPGYLELIEPLPDGARLVDNPDERVEFVQIFVKDQSELEMLGQKALNYCQPTTIFWISYPKKSSGIPSGIHRDIIWKIMEKTGWRPVAMVSIDAIWSAMRLRPADHAGK